MIVTVTAAGVDVIELDDFTRFHVAADEGLDVDSGLRAAGAGLERDGHAFISTDWLQSHGDGSPNWLDGLSGMLAYASSKGWVTDEGVRAHVLTQ